MMKNRIPNPWNPDDPSADFEDDGAYADDFIDE